MNNISQEKFNVNAIKLFGSVEKFEILFESHEIVRKFITNIINYYFRGNERPNLYEIVNNNKNLYHNFTNSRALAVKIDILLPNFFN